MESLKQVLMRRDKISEEEADNLINDCLEDLKERLESGEYAEDICEEWFGLEPDYLMDLLNML